MFTHNVCLILDLTYFYPWIDLEVNNQTYKALIVQLIRNSSQPVIHCTVALAICGHGQQFEVMSFF